MTAVVEISQHLDVIAKEPIGERWSTRVSTIANPYLAAVPKAQLMDLFTAVHDMPMSAAAQQHCQEAVGNRIRLSNPTGEFLTAEEISANPALQRPALLDAVARTLQTLPLGAEDARTRDLISLYATLHEIPGIPPDAINRVLSALGDRMGWVTPDEFLELAKAAKQMPPDAGGNVDRFKTQIKKGFHQVMFGRFNAALVSLSNDKSPSALSRVLDAARETYQAVVELDGEFSGWDEAVHQSGLASALLAVASGRNVSLEGALYVYKGERPVRVGARFEKIIEPNDVSRAYKQQAANAQETRDVKFLYDKVIKVLYLQRGSAPKSAVVNPKQAEAGGAA